MGIKRSGAQSSQKAPAEHFTGTVASTPSSSRAPPGALVART